MISIKNALIIDDNPIESFLIEKTLTKFDGQIQTKTINLPQEALVYLNAMNDPSMQNQVCLPDIVFVDLNMPLMNGLQFLDELEKSPPWILNEISVYILSSSCRSNEIESALKKRLCRGYINKPLDKNKLVKLLGHMNTGQKENIKSIF